MALGKFPMTGEKGVNDAAKISTEIHRRGSLVGGDNHPLHKFTLVQAKKVVSETKIRGGHVIIVPSTAGNKTPETLTDTELSLGRWPPLIRHPADR